MDFGISEREFWDMTIAELIRAVESKKRVQMKEMQQRANMDYILANLIGRSVSRAFSSKNKMPTIAESYPTLFDKGLEDELMEQKKQELSVLRFKQFADAHNRRWKRE